MNLYWSDEYIITAEAFDTTRKSGWIIESLRSSPIDRINILCPAPLSREQLALVHDPRYIQAVQNGHPRSLASSQGFRWDPGLWSMACAHTSGMVAAAQDAWRNRTNAGSLSSGQHHAGHDYGAGFCTFNGIALAAKTVLQAGAERVLIIDLDAHCGGGTWSLIAGNNQVRQLDIAVNPFDSYAPHWLSTFDYIERARDYLPTLEKRLNNLTAGNTHFDICIYYAGMDPYEQCYIGGLPGITLDLLRKREEMVFDWCKVQEIPVAFGIGGGYINPQFPDKELVALHRLTLSADPRNK